jgi:mycothiol synthase
MLETVLTIREFMPGDEDGLAWLENALLGSQITSQDVQARGVPEGVGFVRLVALWDWEIVAAAQATQQHAPRDSRSEIKIGVRLDHRCRGIGSALLGALETFLRERGGEMMLCYASEKDHVGAFLEPRGFSETFRGYSQWLPLERFDPTRFASDERWQREGIRLHSLESLRFNSDTPQQLYELYVQLEQDAPRADTDFVALSFEQFYHNNFEQASSIPEAVTVAVDDDRLVGLNTLYLDSSGDVLHNGLTGVLPEYRGLGLALALKLEGIRVSQRRGIRGITSYNASTNAPILRLNEKLGFERAPATLEWRKVIHSY